MEVFLLGSSTDQDVIKVTYSIWETLQHSVHNLLEDGGCRGHAKGKSSIAKQATVGIDGDIVSGILCKFHLLVSMG